MTSRPALAIAVLCIAAVASAAPRKVLVLPIDGTADAATRGRLTAVVVKLARAVDVAVTTGGTTFAETAAAVGCDPSAAGCADTVLATLAVDEVVWGTAITSNGQTVVVVKRATKGAPAVSQSVTIGAQDPPDKAEPGLAPMFGGAAPPPASPEPGPGSGAASGPVVAPPPASPGPTPMPAPAAPGPGGDVAPRDRDRNLGLSLAIGGGVVLAIGLGLWGEESSIQGQIDRQPTNTIADINQLKSLESNAANYAAWGNVLVVTGLVAGGAGGYFLWKAHRAHVTAVAPAPADRGTGMTVVVGGSW